MLAIKISQVKYRVLKLAGLSDKLIDLKSDSINRKNNPTKSIKTVIIKVKKKKPSNEIIHSKIVLLESFKFD